MEAMNIVEAESSEVIDIVATKEPSIAANASVKHFALTLTLHPRWYKYTVHIQAQKACLEIEHALRCFKKSCYLEFTRKYNVHAHVYFTSRIIDCVEKCVADNLRGSKVFGFYVLKQLLEDKDIEKWKEYISKDINHTLKYIERNFVHSIDRFEICSCHHTMICLPYRSQIS